MRIAVIGAGAMGCLFSGMLARAGHELYIIEQDPERVQALRSTGICIQRQDGSELHIATPEVHSEIPESSPADIVVIAVKSYSTAQAVQDCRKAVGGGTAVLTLQNGLGNIEQVQRFVPAAQILAGTTAQGATLLGHGRVRHAGAGPTVIGPVQPGEAGRASAVSGVFNRAGIQTEVAEDITAMLWAKLLVNAGINALTTILDIPNGALLRSEPLRALLRGAVLEGAAIAARLGVRLPAADPVARTEEVCRATAANISSMLQDRRCGRRTEIESINGALVSYGRQLGIPTPVNSALTWLVSSFPVSA